MKILIVAFSESIHVARWVEQFDGTDWDIRIFPSVDHGRVHPNLAKVKVYHRLFGGYGGLSTKLHLQAKVLFRKGRSFLGTRFLPIIFKNRRLRMLERVVSEFQPDIIHSLEFQAAGYLVVDLKKLIGPPFPLWIATNWGSDIYHFSQYPEHERRIRDLLANCDYYSCECQRDICLAKAYGLRGRQLPVMPNTGGFELTALEALRQTGSVSKRRLVLLKGYQHWVGRALNGLMALERCRELLTDYEIVLYSCSPVTIRAAQTFMRHTGLAVRIIALNTSHQDILRLHGRARISIGLSMSDGISTSFLEALAMGAFPIQSWTSCADEWITDGVSGILVPPEDVNAIEEAIRRALKDDDLVDDAAVLNSQIARDRLDRTRLSAMAVDMYKRVYLRR